MSCDHCRHATERFPYDARRRSFLELVGSYLYAEQLGWDTHLASAHTFLWCSEAEGNNTIRHGENCRTSRPQSIYFREAVKRLPENGKYLQTSNIIEQTASNIIEQMNYSTCLWI